MRYNRKQLRQITGLPDKTLRWVINRLGIDAVDTEYTLFGSPIYIYDDTALDKLHDYIFKRTAQTVERSKGKRCRGGCERYLPESALDSQQICDHCRRYKWILNEVTHNAPLNNTVDKDVIDDIQSILKTLTQ
jgi:hypothetical protein